MYNGFKNGFPSHFEGPIKCYESKILISTNERANIIQQKIANEIELARVEGPFTTTPFRYFRVSPIGLVSKKEPGEFRLIHHLSYPKDDSVNSYIDHDLCSVRYTKSDRTVEMVQCLGQGACLGKSDIK